MCSETDVTQEIVWRHHHLVSGIFETQTLCVIHQPARQVPMSPNLTDWLPFLDKSWSEDRKHLLCKFHRLFYTYFKCPVPSHFMISATVQVLQQYYLGGWERRKFHLRTQRYFKSFALYSFYLYFLFILNMQISKHLKGQLRPFLFVFELRTQRYFKLKHHRWILRVLSCVHGFKRISELFVFSWNEFCSVLHTSKSGLGKFGLLITLETPHYWSVVDHFQSLWEAFQLNTANFLWLWIIWCPKKEFVFPLLQKKEKKVLLFWLKTITEQYF